jgi:hypothetical protein
MGSKGSPGEASIFRAKDGRWHGWITVGTRANGKPDRRHRTAKTRSEVVRKIRELEVWRETGTNTAVNKTRLRRGLDTGSRTLRPDAYDRGRWRATSR